MTADGVIMPTSVRDWRSKTTGIEPTLRSHIIFATFRGIVHNTSCKNLGLLFDFDLIHDPAITSVGLRNTDREIMLGHRVNASGQHD